MIQSPRTWSRYLFFTVFASCGGSKAEDSTEISSGQVSTSSGSNQTATSSSSLSPTDSGSTPPTAGAPTTSGGEDLGPGSSTDQTTGDNTIEPCKTWNDMCPEGTKCNPYFDGPVVGTWNAQGCFPVVESPAGQGESCVFRDPADGTLDSCDKGLVCWSGLCMPLCGGEPSQFVCPTTFACATVNPPDVVVCLPACDPRNSQCASDDDVCAPSVSIFRCSPKEDEKPDFSGCLRNQECKSGFCGPKGAASECESDFCCTPLCSSDQPNCPGMGQQCLPFNGLPQIPEYQNLGFCSL